MPSLKKHTYKNSPRDQLRGDYSFEQMLFWKASPEKQILTEIYTFILSSHTDSKQLLRNKSMAGGKAYLK